VRKTQADIDGEIDCVDAGTFVVGFASSSNKSVAIDYHDVFASMLSGYSTRSFGIWTKFGLAFKIRIDGRTNLDVVDRTDVAVGERRQRAG
jgi:hypothetical protein